MCPRFHADHLKCRLVTTYYGPATQWLPNSLVNRSKLGQGNNGLDDDISEEVTLDNGKLSKGIYLLTQDVIVTGEDEEDEIDALEGDEVEAFEDLSPSDTILGVDVFPVIHKKTKQKIFVSAEDIKELQLGDLL